MPLLNVNSKHVLAQRSLQRTFITVVLQHMTSLNQCAGGFVNNGCDSEGSLQLLDGAPRLEQLFSSDHMYTKHNTEQCAVHADSRLVAWKLVLYMYTG